LAASRVALVATTLVAGALGARALWPEGSNVADKGPTATPGGTLRLTASSGLTWDPMETTDPGLRLLMNRALYRGLVAFDSATDDKPAALVPDLATTTGDTTDKGRTWSFTLRPGVRWEDGTPVTCADAKAGLARAFAAAKFYHYSYEAAVLVDVPQGADGLPVYKGAGTAGKAAFDRAVSCAGSTLTVRLSVPEYEFQRYLALPELAPYRAAPALGPGARSLSNGPYVVEAASVSSTTGTLVRNPRWSPATDTLRPAFPDRIEVATVSVDEVASGLAADALAFRRALTLSALPAAVDSAFASAPDRTQVAPAGVTELLVPNPRTDTMSSSAYRRAFALSTDRASYVSAMGGPAARLEQRSTAGTYHTGPAAGFDVQQARALLAGDHPRLKVAYFSTPESERAMAALSAGWVQAGFAVNRVAFKGDKAGYHKAMGEAAGQTTYDAVRADYVDSLDRSATAESIDPRFRPGLPVGEATTVTAAIDTAIGTAPGPARDAAWRSVDDVVSVLALLVPLANRAALIGTGSAVRGATTSIEFSGAVDPLRASLAPTES
jgi:peptide/nickel transport system substrate-binding protein